jgi:hypothetical protein
MKSIAKIMTLVLAVMTLMTVAPVNAEAATVKPAKTNLTTVTVTSYANEKATVKVTWKKVATNCKGYTIYTKKSRTSKKWSAVKTVKSNKTSATVTINAEEGSRIYVAVRAYNKAGKKKVYAKMSSAKSIRIAERTADNSNSNASTNSGITSTDSSNTNSNNKNTCSHNWKTVSHFETVTDKAAYDAVEEVTHEYNWMYGGASSL